VHAVRLLSFRSNTRSSLSNRLRDHCRPCFSRAHQRPRPMPIHGEESSESRGAAAGGNTKPRTNWLPKSETKMVDKCANPACSATFHRLGEGRLLIQQVRGDHRAGRWHSRQTGYFWLCDSCCCTLTIFSGRGEKIEVAPLPEAGSAAQARAPSGFISAAIHQAIDVHPRGLSKN
jgi:hypothetical protein